jgi:hypothetical protein
MKPQCDSTPRRAELKAEHSANCPHPRPLSRRTGEGRVDVLALRLAVRRALSWADINRNRAFHRAYAPKVAIVPQVVAELVATLVPHVVGQLFKQTPVITSGQFGHSRWPNCRTTDGPIVVQPGTINADRMQPNHKR